MFEIAIQFLTIYSTHRKIISEFAIKTIGIAIEGFQHTDKGESAPGLLSRKKDAESMDATTNKIGLGCPDVILIGGSEDKTLPFRCQKQATEGYKSKKQWNGPSTNSTS